MQKLNNYLTKIINMFKKHDTKILIIYKLFIDVFYVLYINKWFAYAGFQFNFCFYKYVISWIVFLLSIKYVKKTLMDETFSNTIIYLIYLVYFIPNITLYPMVSFSNVYFLLSSIYMFMMLIVNDKIGYIKVKTLNLKSINTFFNIVLVLAPIFILWISYKYTGLRLVFDFINVYKIRLESTQYEIPTIISYLLTLMNVIIPLMLIYCLKNKRKVFAIIMLLSQFILFSITAQKSILLSIIIVLLSYFLYKKDYKRLIAVLFIFLSIFCAFEYSILGSTHIISLIYRRNLYLPPFISYQYYTFFKLHSIDYFTNGIMHWFGFKSIYPDSISNILGNSYYISSTALNNGLFGDAFANLGYLGCFIMPIIIVITFRIADALTYKTKRNILFGFIIYYMMKFVNSFWSTNLLSGGFIITILFLFLMQENNDKDVILEDKEYINFNKIKEKIKLNYKKIILIVLTSVIISSGYFNIINNNQFEKEQYNPYNISKIKNEKNAFIYYSQLKDSATKINDEINEFTYYYKIKDLKFQKELNESFKHIKNSNIIILAYSDNKYEYYQYYDRNNKKNIDINDYYQMLREYYDYVNLVNKELDKNDKIYITYNIKKGIINNYNIELIEEKSSLKNKYGALITFVILSTIMSYIYIILADTKNKKTKKENDIIKICHVTSVHRRHDVRIFQKECTSLAKKYDVTLLCVDDKKDETINNVKIVHENITYKNRINRISSSSSKLFDKAMEIDADIYHLHDPELMLLGNRLLREGKSIIFDSHEDYPGVISSKTWIPKVLRGIITKCYKVFEKRTLCKYDAVITATPHVQDRLVKINKNTFMVTNFPILYDLDKKTFDNYLCFAGGLTPQWSHKQIIESLYDIDVKYKMAGKKDEKYYKMLETLDDYKKVEYLGFLSKDEVQKLYANASIGMAICQESANVNWHQGNLANTKLFEYMAAGVPVICSDFVIWEKIVEENNCGIAVDTNNIEEIHNAIKKLLQNKKLLQEMSRNGIKAAKEKYNWNSQEKELFKVYSCIEKKLKDKI